MTMLAVSEAYYDKMELNIFPPKSSISPLSLKKFQQSCSRFFQNDDILFFLLFSPILTTSIRHSSLTCPLLHFQPKLFANVPFCPFLHSVLYLRKTESFSFYHYFKTKLKVFRNVKSHLSISLTENFFAVGNSFKLVG